jgi:hypothetical protein
MNVDKELCFQALDHMGRQKYTCSNAKGSESLIPPLKLFIHYRYCAEVALPIEVRDNDHGIWPMLRKILMAFDPSSSGYFPKDTSRYRLRLPAVSLFPRFRAATARWQMYILSSIYHGYA